MSNKKKIKPSKPEAEKKTEEKRFSFAKSRLDPINLVPAIIFIVIAIWYFISSRP